MTARYDQKEMISYLLGALPDADGERLDELSIADDQFAGELSAAEHDLVDSYVMGELSGEMLRRFQDHYLASPLRHDKVRFAQAFAGLMAENTAAQPKKATKTSPPRVHQPKRSRASWLGAWLAPQVGWGLAALAFVLLVAGGYLLRQNRRLRDQVAQGQAERARLDETEQLLRRQLDAQQSTGAEAMKELAEIRERLAQLEQNAATYPPSQTEPVGKLFAFTLAPPTRGLSQPPVLSVPPGTTVVSMTLELEATDFKLYRVALKDLAAGQIVWRSDRLKASNAGGKPVLKLRLNPALLKSQNYGLELSGLTPEGGWEPLETYTFHAAAP